MTPVPIKADLTPGKEALWQAIALSPGHGLSEYCLPNLYLYRQAHHYEYFDGKFPYIRGFTYDGAPHIMPLFDMSCCPDWLVKQAKATNAMFYPIPEQALVNIDLKRFRVDENPDDFDYIYKVADLSTFERPELREKRRQMRRLVEQEAPEAVELTNAQTADVLSILDKWLTDVAKHWKQTDYEACREAILLRDALHLFGYIYYTKSGNPAGFILAGKLTQSSAAVHFAKGARRYEGIFPFMFNHLAKKCMGNYQTLNFEQDMGKPGFRQSKRSYAPAMQLRKLRLFPL